MNNKKMKKVENALWMCNYWAHKVFARNPDSPVVWMFLMVAEEIRWEMEVVK